MKWLRLYVEVLDDPKVQTLSDFDFRFLVNLWCLARLNNGVLPPESDIAFHLRQRRPTVGSALVRLWTSGLLDLNDGKYSPHNWDERQFASDDISLRVKAYRDRKKDKSNVTCNVTKQKNVTLHVTPSDTDTDTEDIFEATTSSKISSVPSFQAVKTSPQNGRKPRSTQPKKQPIHMSSEQEDWYRQYMNLHPKGDIQVASSMKMWAVKVKDRDVFDWLMTELRRQRVADTTYMLGPGKWLADQLERYARGLTSAPNVPTVEDSASAFGFDQVFPEWKPTQ